MKNAVVDVIIQAVVIALIVTGLFALLLDNKPMKLKYNVEEDAIIVEGIKTCKVYERFNKLGFKADVIICEVQENG